MMPSSPPKRSEDAEQRPTSPLHLQDIDHVHYYVGNAKQAAMFYAQHFGFDLTQVQNLSAENRDQASYLLTQGNIRLLLTTSLRRSSPLQQEVLRFGDGIKDIAFSVEDAQAAFELAVSRGAKIAYKPVTDGDSRGSVTRAGIRTFGRVVHSFISRRGDYALSHLREGGPFAPGYRSIHHPLSDYNALHPVGLHFIDHCVGNVPSGEMDTWADWYAQIFDFSLVTKFADHEIATEHTALHSKVMASVDRRIKMPINEPASGRCKSQVLEFLEWHDMTAGIQHLALHTDDPMRAVGELRRRGVEFLDNSKNYYEQLWQQAHGGTWKLRESPRDLQEMGLLIDTDEDGYMLQIFTLPLQDRPTLFLEIICRRGSKSFGKGNFNALFQSIEREQKRRGNL